MHTTGLRHQRHASSRLAHAYRIASRLLAAGAYRLQVLAAFGLLVLVNIGCGGSSLNHVVQRDLLSKDGLTCRGHLGWNNPNVQHVFLWMNGTGVYSSAFVHPSAEEALKANPAAYLTFDKPGIHAPFQDPAALVVNDDELARYTQGHMLECARRAMTWSEEQFGRTVQFHFRGHSEGTLIALFLYEKLLSEEPTLAARVSSLVLSGLGLEPFDALIERQLQGMTPEQGRTIRAAIEGCSWPLLKRHLAVSCKYLEDAYARPSGRSVFESIARRAPSVRFFVFQGNDDFHTPAKYVRELQTWNDRLGHLDLTFRFYDGAHVGSPPGVKRELSDLLVRLTAPSTPRSADTTGSAPHP